MGTVPLPENPSLEHLKSQAKLVKQLVASQDDGALAMIDEYHPRLGSEDVERDPSTFKLSDAQLTVARLYGFDSWAKLKQHVGLVEAYSYTPAAGSTAADSADGGSVDSRTRNGAIAPRDGVAVESFVSIACVSYSVEGPNPARRIERAHELLGANPQLAQASITASVVVGDSEAVAEHLSTTAAAATATYGPNQWPLILYATYSRLWCSNDHDELREQIQRVVGSELSLTKTVAVLLNAGSDPNAGFLLNGLVPPFTALTGALGGGESGQPRHRYGLEIAELLLAAGADPNDNQGLYNTALGAREDDNPEHLKLLVRYGLGFESHGPWYELFGERLGRPDELLYGQLADAAHKGRAETVKYLVGLGLDLDRPVGRHRRTPVRLAAAEGHTDVLDVLAAQGVDVTLTPVEQFFVYVRAGEVDALRAIAADTDLLQLLLREHPDAISSVPSDGADTLMALAALGFDIDAQAAGSGKTALHCAVEADDLAKVKMLIQNGANPNIRDTYVNATPWNWANHFDKHQIAEFLQPLTSN